MKVRQWLPAAALAAALAGALTGFAPVATAEPMPSDIEPVPSDTGVLTLIPPSGVTGTEVEAVASRLKCSLDFVEFSWVGYEEVPWTDPVTTDQGGISATTTVPSSFTPGAYVVRATCYYPGGAEYAAAPFTVTPSEPETSQPGQPQPPTPNEQSPPTLTLRPTIARPGDAVTARIEGLDCTPEDVTVRWADDKSRWNEPVAEEGGIIRATTTVPETMASGSHPVIASCRYLDDSRWPRANLVVTDGGRGETAETPLLTIKPMEGPAGSQITATASGHLCRGDVVFLWHGDIDAGKARAVNGTATRRVTVPTGVGPGAHDLLARCTADGFAWPLAYFTVTNHVATGTPLLVVDPTEGPAGSEITATATGHPCRGDVVFLWHDGLDAGTAKPDQRAATTSLTVPADLSPGAHDLLARCAADGYTWPPTRFTVTGDTAVTETASGGQDTRWWPIVGVMVLILAAALRWLTLRRGPRWVRLHVRAVPGAAARAGMETAESPADRFSRDVTIRIEPHPDPGTQTFRQVDP